MKKTIQILVACSVFFAAQLQSSETGNLPDLQKQVADTELAFAETMARRDFEGFVSFLADEAVFFSEETPVRGKQQVANAWKPYYEQADAPFSWKPETVVVLESGTLALSSGPVFNPEGKRVATFNSIWRLEAPGEWRIVFDKGNAACESPEP